jgi:hypothetical protein
MIKLDVQSLQLRQIFERVRNSSDQIVVREVTKLTLDPMQLQNNIRT